MSDNNIDDLGRLLKRLGASDDDDDADDQSSYVEPYYSGQLVTKTGAFAYVKAGFSWTTLFFGPLVPLFRGDLKYFLIMVISDFLIFPWWMWACDYNTRYIVSLLERGYYPETKELRAGLRLKGFPL